MPPVVWILCVVGVLLVVFAIANIVLECIALCRREHPSPVTLTVFAEEAPGTEAKRYSR